MSHIKDISCNAGIGMFKDSIDKLYSAIKYLSQFKEIQEINEHRKSESGY